MKAKLLRVLLLVTMVHTMNSCSTDGISTEPPIKENPVITYNYSPSELETLALINEYRVSKGLSSLKKNDYISLKSEEHNNDMITNNEVSHNGFVDRSECIMSVLGAKKVGENVAYNYCTSQSVVSAWLNSPCHKENIEGDYNNFGISIRENSEGKKYYTNIFAKI